MRGVVRLAICGVMAALLAAAAQSRAAEKEKGYDVAMPASGVHSSLICRIRPCDKPSPLVSVCEEQGRVEVVPEKHPGEPLRFDRVLGPQQPSDQEVLFDLVRPAVLSCLQGLSCTIVAHGGPQAGKSYTLSGLFTHTRFHGLAPRAIQFIMELMDRDPAGIPAIEASFFEMQQELVCDLVPRGCPRVTLREMAQPPFMALDPNLTTHRCDGAEGYNKLLDTFFAGLEHRRKNAHTCFQISFIGRDGHQLSTLRFVEIAWPKPRTHQSGCSSPTLSPSPSMNGLSSSAKSLALLAGTTTGGGGSLKMPQAGAAQIEAILQAKLSNHAVVPYRASPLATLLKPCFEGASSLIFLHCLRLEHTQLASLAQASPLVTKLHAWLLRQRQRVSPQFPLKACMPAAHFGTAVVRSASAPVLPHNTPPAVPRLRIESVKHGTDVQVLPPDHSQQSHGQHNITRSSCSSTTSMSSTDLDESMTIGAAPIPPLQATGFPPVLAGVAVSGQMVLPAPEEYHVPHGPPEQDSRTLNECVGLLEAKHRSAETLRADAARSAAVLDDLGTVLAQLQVHRHEGGGDTGPTEKETNLRMLYEKVSKSLQRTTEELRKIHDDIEALSQFCGGGAMPPAYDSYNVQDGDVEKMKAHFAATAAAGHASLEGLNLLQPQAPAPLPLSSGLPAAAEHAAPCGRGTAAARSPSPVVPSLPFAMLAREHVEVASTLPPQAQLSPPRRRGLAPGCSSSRSSSSTSSSSGTSPGRSPAALRACSMPATPPTLARAGGQWLGACAPASSSGALARPLSFSLLPQGPPVVPLAAPATVPPATVPPATTDPRAGSVFRFPAGPGCSLVARSAAASPSRAAPCLRPTPAATFGGDTPIDAEEGGSTPKYVEAEQSRSPAPGLVTKSVEPLQRSVSALRPARTPMVSRPARPDAAEVFADAAMRKSYSTASLRGGRAPGAHASPAPMPGRSSPLVGHRPERLGSSPLRSSPAVTPASVVATFGGPSVASVPSLATTSTGASSPLPPKRSVLPAPRVGPPRLVGGPSRAATPGPPRSGSTCATGHIGARPGQASPSSPSPVLLGRSVSSQVLRLERAQGAAAAAAAAAVPPRSRAMPKQPSSERSNGRLGVSETSPLRAAWATGMSPPSSLPCAAGTQPRQCSHAGPGTPVTSWGGPAPVTPPAGDAARPSTTPRTGHLPP